MAKGVSSALIGVLFLCACGEVETRLVLRAALEPNPFKDVATVQVVALGRDGLVELPEVRWDQGPQRLEQRVPLTARRIWVVGKTQAGASVSAALSPPLDLLAEPPEAMTLDFARIGALSEMGQVERREGWRALPLGQDGTLLLGGTGDDGRAPSATFRIDPYGNLVDGPPLPDGAPRPEVSRVGRDGVVWDERGWRVLRDVGFSQPVEIPSSQSFDVGARPALVPLGARKALAFGAGQVFELDVSSGQNTQFWPWSSTTAVAASSFLPGRAVTVTEDVLRIFNTSAGSVTTSARLSSTRRGAGLARTVAGSVIVVGGHGSDVSARFGEGGAGAVGLTVLGGEPLGPARAWAVGPWVVGVSDDGTTGSVRHLLRGEATRVDAPGPLRLAPHPDGTLRGVSDSGALLLFQPGPEILSPGAHGEGWTPSVPGAFRVEGGDVVATSTRAVETNVPTAWAVLGTASWSEVELDLVVEAVGGGLPSVLLGFDGERFDEVRLGTSALVGAGPSRPVANCASVTIPALAERAEVRVVYDGAVVTVDVGRDGSPELQCDRPDLHGHVALGVREQGAARFRLLRLRGVP